MLTRIKFQLLCNCYPVTPACWPMPRGIASQRATPLNVAKQIDKCRSTHAKCTREIKSAGKESVQLREFHLQGTSANCYTPTFMKLSVQREYLKIFSTYFLSAAEIHVLSGVGKLFSRITRKLLGIEKKSDK